MTSFIHDLAIVEDGSTIGEASRVWRFAHVRRGARIGASCRIGEGVYIDVDVTIGDRCKIQNRVTVYAGVTLEEGVFVGPHVTFTNDKVPRAIHPDGRSIEDDAWTPLKTRVERGASIGAGAVVLPGTTLGAWCMIGSGAVVTRSVPPYGLVLGNPARLAGVVNETGKTVSRTYAPGQHGSVVIKPEWVP